MVKLIRAGKAGSEVKFQFVRAGQLQSVTVKLAEQPPHFAENDHQNHDLWERQFPWAPLSPLRHQWRMQRGGGRNHWERFDSLNLKKLDGDRFRAEIAYLDKDGKKQNRAFEGTREEIRKLIESEKDLPTDERDQLLQGLDLHPRFEFPDFLDEPFEWPDPFKDL